MSRFWWRGLLLVTLLSLTLLGGACAVITAQAQGPDAPVDLAEFRGRLAEAEQVLRRFDGADEEAIQAARLVLAPVKAVRLPSGETVNLFEPLLPGGISRSAAVERLDLLRDQLAAADQDAAASQLAVLESVLARPEFLRLNEASLWLWLMAWLQRLLGGLLPSEPELSMPQAPAGTDWAVAGGTGLVLALLLGYWLQGVLRNFVAEAEAQRRQEEDEAAPTTAAVARQQATSLAQAGAYRQAVRALYLSALLRLEEGGLLRADRSLTNREHLAQVAGNALLQQRLQPVVQTFDEVWYGVREPDRETFHRYERDVEALSEVVP